VLFHEAEKQPASLNDCQNLIEMSYLHSGMGVGKLMRQQHVLIPFPWNQLQNFQTVVFKWVKMWQKFQTLRLVNIKTVLHNVKVS
jgi:hypothetical protein